MGPARTRHSRDTRSARRLPQPLSCRTPGPGRSIILVAQPCTCPQARPSLVLTLGGATFLGGPWAGLPQSLFPPQWRPGRQLCPAWLRPLLTLHVHSHVSWTRQQGRGPRHRFPVGCSFLLCANPMVCLEAAPAPCPLRCPEPQHPGDRLLCPLWRFPRLATALPLVQGQKGLLWKMMSFVTVITWVAEIPWRDSREKCSPGRFWCCALPSCGV